MANLQFLSRLKTALRVIRGEENFPPSYGKMAVRDRLGEIKSRITSHQPLIIDGGANLGSVTDALLGYYPSAAIHAFEPIPQLADALRVKYAHCPHIVVHAKALGAEPKTLTFHQLNNIDSSSFLTPSAIQKKYHGQKVAISNELAVEQVRLDDMVDGDIDILKLDLQGYELEALKGAERSLPSTKLILIEVEFVPLYENQPLFGDIDVFLRERGFFLLNLYELWTHPDGQLTSGDAIYLNTRYFKP
jgi:FkbM family methyltransferase